MVDKYTMLPIYLFIAIIITTAYSLLFEFVGFYSVPPAIEAIYILRENKIEGVAFSSPEYKYWYGTQDVERKYPFPAIMLAIVKIVTDIPLGTLPLLPLPGIVIVIIFYLILKLAVWEFKNILNKFVLISFLTMYLAVFTLLGLHAFYVGRATLGVALAMLYVFVLIKLHVFKGIEVPSVVALIFLMLASTFTYYTTSLAVFVLPTILLMSGLISKNSKGYNSNINMNVLKTLAIIGLILIYFQPIVSSLVKSASPSTFFYNLYEFVLAQLKLEKESEAYMLNVGYVEIDLFTRITGVWFSYFIRIAIVVIVTYTFMRYLLSRTTKTIEWVIAAIAIGGLVAELPYTLYAPTVSLRFVTIFGVPLLLLIVVKGFQNKGKSRHIVVRLFSIIIMVVVLLNFFANIYSSTKYSHPRIFGIENIRPLTKFICSNSGSHIQIAASDAYYAAFLTYFCVTSNSMFITVPLGKNAISLKLALHNVSMLTDFIIYNLKEGGITYLVYVDDGYPLFGDAWGYAVSLSPFDFAKFYRYMSLIYVNGKSVVLTLSI